MIGIFELAQVLAIIGAALALYELIRVAPLRRRIQEAASRSAAIEVSQKQLTDLGARIVDADRQLRAQISLIGDKMTQLELRGDSRPYEQAINVAANGGEAERLISYFGLTEGEASLVRLLHGRERRAAKHNAG
jgi:hypothetical protein